MLSEEHTLETAEQLVAAIKAGDESLATSRIMELVREFESGLYQEIGKLTRVVHEAMKNLAEDSGLAQITTSHIPDARERLDFVLEKTADATHRTLESVERLMPMSDDLVTSAKDIKGYWGQAVRDAGGDIDFSELTRVLDAHVASLEGQAETLRHGLSEVLMAQSFQDLTGQVIRRTMELVADVEDKLIELVVKTPGGASGPDELSMSGAAVAGAASAQEQRAGEIAAPEGPAVGKRDDVVSGQDEVDDLLSSLGF